jgi:hypothetical protein
LSTALPTARGGGTIMMHQKVVAAENIRAHLLPTEDKIDEAISLSAQLIATMIKARTDTGVAAAVGHTAIAQVSAAQAQMVEARRAMIRAHKALVDAGGDVGVLTTGYGQTSECPEIETTKTAGHLRAVG